MNRLNHQGRNTHEVWAFMMPGLASFHIFYFLFSKIRRWSKSFLLNRQLSNCTPIFFLGFKCFWPSKYIVKMTSCNVNQKNERFLSRQIGRSWEKFLHFGKADIFELSETLKHLTLESTVESITEVNLEYVLSVIVKPLMTIVVDVAQKEF